MSPVGLLAIVRKSLKKIQAIVWKVCSDNSLKRMQIYAIIGKGERKLTGG
jgi:hypothetical protein